MSDGLKAWLDVELNKLGWSYRELARRMGVSQSVLSRVLSGQKKRVNPDFYKESKRRAQEEQNQKEVVH